MSSTCRTHGDSIMEKRRNSAQALQLVLLLVDNVKQLIYFLLQRFVLHERTWSVSDSVIGDAWGHMEE